jgi:hypothetical protein
VPVEVKQYGLNWLGVANLCLRRLTQVLDTFILLVSNAQTSSSSTNRGAPTRTPDQIAAQIEAQQLSSLSPDQLSALGLAQHSCKPLCYAAHCASSPASLFASCPFISQRGSSSVLMRHWAVNTVTFLRINCTVSAAVPLRASYLVRLSS